MSESSTSLPIDIERVRNAIEKQIQEDGMDKLTSRMIRNNLKTIFNIDFTEYKAVIDKITMEIVEETAQKQAKDESDECESESDGPVFTDIPRKSKEKSKSARTRKRRSSESDSELLEVGQKRRCVAKKTPKKRASNGVSSKPRKKGGYGGYCALTEELAAFVGQQFMRRCDVIKTMWAYFRSHNLLDPKDKRFVLADEALAKLLKKKRFLAFGVMKDLSSHIIDPKHLNDEERAALERYEAEQDASRENADKEEVNEEGKKESNVSAGGRSESDDSD